MKVEVGDRIPEWTLERVTPERMRTVAAIFRDPNPVHWDREFSERVGLAGRVVNQSPVNLGYVVNMLLAWTGPASLRRLRVEFPAPVLDGDRVMAGGVVKAIHSEDGRRLAECEVWLDRQDGQRAVQGIAVVELPTGG
jgi:acyl dehydratase